jgi:ATP-binding cassette subfamily F protein uup
LPTVPSSVTTEVASSGPAKPKTKLTFKEQRELETLEAEMEALETRKHEVVEKLNTGANHEELAKWATEIKAIENELSDKEIRWLELSE